MIPLQLLLNPKPDLHKMKFQKAQQRTASRELETEQFLTITLQGGMLALTTQNGESSFSIWDILADTKEGRAMAY